MIHKSIDNHLPYIFWFLNVFFIQSHWIDIIHINENKLQSKILYCNKDFFVGIKTCARKEIKTLFQVFFRQHNFSVFVITRQLIS